MSVNRKETLTVVTLSISPVVPEVGVLLEVLSYTCCSHPGTLQKEHEKTEVSNSLVYLNNLHSSEERHKDTN